MRLSASSSAALAAIVSALVCSSAPVGAKDVEKPDASAAPVQRSPEVLAPQRGMPGLTKQPEQGGVIAPRTHCNGSCMCTGTDCDADWVGANCKDGTVTCSGGIREPGKPDEVNDKICTCIRKAASD